MVEEILSIIPNMINEAIGNVFGGSRILYQLGAFIWNMAMSLVGTVASTTPQAFSQSAWNYVVNDVLDFTMAAAATLLNTFYLIGIFRQSTNLRDKFTMEVLVETLIRMVLANMLILNGLDLIVLFFNLASSSAGAFIMEVPSIVQEDGDFGFVLFEFIFGWLFLLVAVVCAFTIILSLWSRYLHLYLLVATYPLALSTIPGGSGVSTTASSWVREFFGKTFEILIIAFAVVIASYMCVAIDFGSTDIIILSGLDGFVQALQSLATMIVMTAAVKGAEFFMRKTFGL